MIIKGSDIFIDTVIWFTRITKIPDIIIGATLVSLGTTLPELMVSVGAAVQGNTEIAIGNALGSIICNTGLILAIIIIVSGPIFKDKKEFQRKGILLILLLMLISLAGFVYGEISRLTGIFLLVILIWYLFRNIRKSLNSKTKQSKDCKPINISKKIIISNLFMFVLGLTLTIWGSQLLVINGEKIALFLGVPDVIIGLTMTAFGTSLPELMTAITALRKKAYGISMGNILGANILNIILVIALSSTILPIPINKDILYFHLPFVLLIVSITIFFSFISKNYFRRRFGFIMVIAYINYLLFTFDLF